MAYQLRFFQENFDILYRYGYFFSPKHLTNFYCQFNSTEYSLALSRLLTGLPLYHYVKDCALQKKELKRHNWLGFVKSLLAYWVIFCYLDFSFQLADFLIKFTAVECDQIGLQNTRKKKPVRLLPIRTALYFILQPAYFSFCKNNCENREITRQDTKPLKNHIYLKNVSQ